MRHFAVICGLLALSSAACTVKNGANGSSCSVTANPDGSATISCTNGPSTTVEPGASGATGATGAAGVACTVADNADTGTSTITCPGGSATVSDGHGPCSTLKGDLNIHSQLDIAAFQAAGCAEIDGNLNITSYDSLLSTADIVGDLSGFSNLTEVTGSIDIEGASDVADSPNDPLQATSLQGFQNLVTVGGALTINSTTWATDANFASLTTVGQINIAVNSALLTIEMPLLTTSGSDIHIQGNNVLASVTLTRLATAPGNLDIEYNVLTSLNFPLLTAVSGDLTVDNEPDLASLTFGAAPVTVGNNVDISSDASLCSPPLSSDFTVTDTNTVTESNDGTDVSCP